MENKKNITKKAMYLHMVLSSLIRRRARLFVAVLAITIGATILSGLVTIYYDIPRQLGREFRSYGANFILFPKDEKLITQEDLQKLNGIIGKERIVGSAPYRYKTIRINEQPFILAGTDMVEAKKNSPFWHVEGEWVFENSEFHVMIGKEIAKRLNLSVGDTFIVKGVKEGGEAVASSQTFSAEEHQNKDSGNQFYDKKLTVKGIITTGGKEEGFVFIDMNLLNQLIEDDFRADVVENSVEANQEELEALSKKIASELPHIQGRAVRRVTQSQDIVLGKLQALVYIVTVVVLIITMISVATTMMVVVAERRREIGLKKALGAENGLIVKEILGEGVMLGLLGGIIGTVLGFVFAQEVSLSVFGRAITFQWGLAPITVIVFVGITMLSSLFPIRKVLDIDPAIVLRGE